MQSTPKVSHFQREYIPNAEIKFPIAEHFVAPQGEGLFAGAMMLFVRFAGCSVGKQFTTAEKSKFKILNDYQTKCTAWDGREFACDTDYSADIKLSIQNIVDMASDERVHRVCLTGGEPLIHENLPRLITALLTDNISVHIETSGTKPLERIRRIGGITYQSNQVWITVSPKQGFLADEIKKHANEVKILIDDKVEEQDVMKMLSAFSGSLIQFWVQPINHEHSINKRNVDLCLELMKKHPRLRLSLQLHKVIGTR